MGMQAAEEDLAGIFSSLWPHFNERDRRLVAAACAQAMGHGGVTTVSKTSGLSRPTVTKAISELHEEPLASGRVRKEGAGRRSAAEADPGLERALDALVDPESRGDPESPLRWTIKSTRQLASALADGGRPVAPNTVRSLLYRLGYSLQSNAKVAEGAQHPDRNAQFGYINEQVRRHLRRGEPVVSVDAKKKELIGNYKNAGAEWRKAKSPRAVNTYDFIDKEAGKAIPYGVYDIKLNRGFVSVGTDADTAAFAVATLRSWWAVEGANAYPRARQAARVRRRRRLQRLPAPAMEDRTGPLGRRRGDLRHGMPLPAGDLQVEQDRAPPVLGHFDQLEGPAPHQPRSRSQLDRRYHQPGRAHRKSPT